jgi:hypothetical protein
MRGQSSLRVGLLYARAGAGRHTMSYVKSVQYYTIED